MSCRLLVLLLLFASGAGCEVPNPAYHAHREGEPNRDGSVIVDRDLTRDAADLAPDTSLVAPLDAAAVLDDGGPAPREDATVVAGDAGTTSRARGLVGHYDFEGAFPLVPDLSGSGHALTIDCVDPCFNGLAERVPGPTPGARAVQLAWWQRGYIEPSPALAALDKHFTIATRMRRVIHYEDARPVLGRKADTGTSLQAFALSFVNGHASVRIGTARVTAAVATEVRTWLTLAARFDGRLLTLFIDGVVVGQVEVAAPPPAASTRLYLGTIEVGGNDAYADADFDELWIYDQALDDAAIAAIGEP